MKTGTYRTQIVWLSEPSRGDCVYKDCGVKMGLCDILEKVNQLGKMAIKDHPVAINLRRHVKIIDFNDVAEPIIVKLYSDKTKGLQEAELLRLLESYMPAHVSRLVDIVDGKYYAATIVKYVNSKEIVFTNQTSSEIGSAINDILEALNKIGYVRLTYQNDCLGYEDVINYVKEDVSLTPHFWDYVDNRVPVLISGLHCVSQHGDFTLSNLAVNEFGNLTIFDWEDYGVVRFPGFDLATILFSFFFNLGKIDEVMKSAERLDRLTRENFGNTIYANVGLGSNQFLWLFPFYMMCFLYLKSKFGYGEGIISRTKATLCKIFSSPDWKSYIACV